MDEFQVIVAERILGVEQATKALSQWTSYINKECTFANANTFEKAKAMPGATFWQMHGSTLPVLQRLAMLFWSQPVSVWSTYGWIQSKLRSRLLPNRARKLVIVFCLIGYALKMPVGHRSARLGR